jgi:hypothetical protein
MNIDLGNGYRTRGPVASFEIVKFGKRTKAQVGDLFVSTVARAGSGADALIGITGKLPPEKFHGVWVDGVPQTPEPDPDPWRRADVIHVGLASVLLGGAVVNGDFITSDATGRGVRAVAGDRFIAIALEDGAAGAGIEVLVQIGQLAAASMPAAARAAK